MLEQPALHLVGEPRIGVAEMSTDDAGDLAVGGALAPLRDGIDGAAQKAAPRRGGLAAGTAREFAGRAEIPIERGW
jgi:hypothetical protein